MTFNGHKTIPHFSLSHIRELESFTDADAAVVRILSIYQKNCEIIHRAFHLLCHGCHNEFQDVLAELKEATYPYIAIIVDSKDLNLDVSLSYGVVTEPGVYGTTITRPDIFADYYKEQIQYIIERHNIPVYVGVSDTPIPMPFVIENTPSQLDPEQIWKMQNGFVLPNLSRIDDEIANCTFETKEGNPKPLSLFTAERVDYSLQRLYHYTGTAPEHFQSFVLLTNYQRYIDEFIAYGLESLENSEEFSHLVMPGNVIIANQNIENSPIIGEEPKHLPQMPAYHLKRPDGQGITFINIGVGPSNAKNITDHLAVLRPHCWVMLGHCAGLRSNQVLGDYILAHAYVREDRVLDQDLPAWIPIPAIAEVQLALQDAVITVAEKNNEEHDIHSLKIRMRTGTVVSTDNRNWELRMKELSERFKQSRAIALDMESATVAANGFRFRVPYGTLLCVSDKPMHGELKLKGMANTFYHERVSQHLKIGVEAMRILRDLGVDQLHSRKLRGFDEPPLR
jgi:AMP nucleosidase